MADMEPPRIEFPCANYPIKVMGEASAEFRQHVLNVFQQFAPEFNSDEVVIHPSRNGRYESVNVAITATGVDQLTAIFEALKKHPAVRMVL